uniref:tRNA pseudouridine(55) synthase n=1 Tax=Meloidogyne incognita TaxID=6306 RepID=A0A914MXN9_MELIC
MLLPTKRCKFTISIERDPIFIAGRYCKFSRNLPQSAWGFDGENGQNGGSVGERITDVLVKHFGANSSRFTPSGREDVDVRMLGTGRPFVVQLLNARRTSCLNYKNSTEKLQELANEINSDPRKEVVVNSLAQVNAKQALILNVGLEEKRKVYSALCYSKIPLKDDFIEKLSSKCPVEILQKTAIRVLKRRPLLDRQRTIFWMKAQKLDSFHFQLRLQTQAGTYVKEFVHSDFGRTRPSLAELMDLELGTVDILRLDVLSVELEWPPLTSTMALQNEKEKKEKEKNYLK